MLYRVEVPGIRGGEVTLESIDEDIYPVLWVSVRPFVELWINSFRSDIVPPYSDWPPSEQSGRKMFLMQCPRLPLVGAQMVKYRLNRTIWNLFRNLPVFERPDVGFSNGRHRFRAMEGLGATAIPVQVAPDNLQFLSDQCGRQ